MLFVSSYESQSSSLPRRDFAVTEPRPATIADQRWIFQMNGVALVDIQGKTNTAWYRDQLLISPNLGTALTPALARYSIPPVPGATPWMQVRVRSRRHPELHLRPHQAVDMGFAVDRAYRTVLGPKAGTRQTLQNLISGMLVDVAVRDSDAICTGSVSAFPSRARSNSSPAWAEDRHQAGEGGIPHRFPEELPCLMFEF